MMQLTSASSEMEVTGKLLIAKHILFQVLCSANTASLFLVLLLQPGSVFFLILRKSELRRSRGDKTIFVVGRLSSNPVCSLFLTEIAGK